MKRLFWLVFGCYLFKHNNNIMALRGILLMRDDKSFASPSELVNNIQTKSFHIFNIMNTMVHCTRHEFKVFVSLS